MWKRFSAARASKMHRQATSDTKKDAQKKQYRKGQLDETLKQKKCTATTAVKRKRKKPVTHSSSDHGREEKTSETPTFMPSRKGCITSQLKIELLNFGRNVKNCMQLSTLNTAM